MLVSTLGGEGRRGLKKCTVCTLMKMLTFLDGPLPNVKCVIFQHSFSHPKTIKTTPHTLIKYEQSLNTTHVHVDLQDNRCTHATKLGCPTAPAVWLSNHLDSTPGAGPIHYLLGGLKGVKKILNSEGVSQRKKHWEAESETKICFHINNKCLRNWC